MDCYNENMPISDYCNHCKISINFSFELYNAIKKYLDNNGKLDNLETLSVETCIPLWREACKTWSLNIDDLNEKKTISSGLEDKMMIFRSRHWII